MEQQCFLTRNADVYTINASTTLSPSFDSFSIPARCSPEEVFEFADGQERGDDQDSDGEEKRFLDLLHVFLNPPVRLVVMKRLHVPVFCLGWMHHAVVIRTMLYWNTLSWFSELEFRRLKRPRAGDGP